MAVMLVAPIGASCQATGKLVGIIMAEITFAFYLHSLKPYSGLSERRRSNVKNCSFLPHGPYFRKPCVIKILWLFHSKYNPRRTHHQRVEKWQRQEHGARVKEEERDIRAALWKNWSNPRKTSTLGRTLCPNHPPLNTDTKCINVSGRKKKNSKWVFLSHHTLNIQSLWVIFAILKRSSEVCNPCLNLLKNPSPLLFLPPGADVITEINEENVAFCLIHGPVC